jgi:hypothetical protein
VTKKQHAPRLSENARKAPPERASTKKQPLRSSESDEKEAGGTTGASAAAQRRAEIERQRAEAEAAAEAERAAEAAAAKAARIEKLREDLHSGGTITERLAPVRWLVRGWLAEDFLGAIAAPPKAGKSFFALHFAACLAKGERFHPSLEDPPRPLRVIYCAFEKGSTVRDRVEAYEVEHGKLPATFYTYAPRRPFALSEAEAVADFTQLVADTGAELVIFDTLARVEGDFEENTVEGTRGVVEALDKIRGSASLFYVHHYGHSREGQRGSTNLLAAVDIEVKVSGVPATGLTVEVKQSNAAEAPPALAYRVITVALPPVEGDIEKRSVGVLVPTNAPELGDILGPRIVEVLRESFPEGASRAQLLKALNEDLTPGEKGVGEKSLGKALTATRKAEKIRKTGEARNTRWHAPPEVHEEERERF